jgi:hypothetical protein
VGCRSFVVHAVCHLSRKIRTRYVFNVSARLRHVFEHSRRNAPAATLPPHRVPSVRNVGVCTGFHVARVFVFYVARGLSIFSMHGAIVHVGHDVSATSVFRLHCNLDSVRALSSTSVCVLRHFLLVRLFRTTEKSKPNGKISTRIRISM